jgi:hypothetical protein
MWKKVIILLVFSFLLLPTKVRADILDIFLNIAFNSAIETDRQQSQFWHMATKNSPATAPGKYHIYKPAILKKEYRAETFFSLPMRHYTMYESNIIVAGTNPGEFNRAVSIARCLINYNDYIITSRTLAMFIKFTATLLEINAVMANDKAMNNYLELPRVFVISFEFKL